MSESDIRADVARLVGLTHVGGVVWGIDDGRALERVLRRLDKFEQAARATVEWSVWDGEKCVGSSCGEDFARWLGEALSRSFDGAVPSFKRRTCTTILPIYGEWEDATPRGAK